MTALRKMAHNARIVRCTMRYRAFAFFLLLAAARSAMALDLAELWDFNRPDVSEQRFRVALATAKGDDALILQTQIARTYGLRKEFDRARAHLQSLQPAITSAGPEARARYSLELGRTYASAAHSPESVAPVTKERARTAYQDALAIARSAGLDNLAIDAVHMLAFVDNAPQDQLKWGREALAIVESSGQPAAKRWEGSIRNNIGYALHQLGRYDEALVEFDKAAKLAESGTNAETTRVAYWMVAWTLRALKRTDEALAIQLRLEQEFAAAGKPDAYVYEELEALYRDKGDEGRATRYARLKKQLQTASEPQQ